MKLFIFCQSILFLLALLGFSDSVSGRSATTDLLEVEDILEIYLDDFLVGSYRLWPFPFIEAYTENVTVSGNLCFVSNSKEFKEQCYDQANDSTSEWTNQLLSDILEYNVNAVLISSETQIDSGGYYIRPLAPLAWPQRTDLKAVLRHSYITNCSALRQVSDQLFYVICTLGLMIIVWVVLIWGFYDEQYNVLQKSILIIPLFKFLRLSIYTVFLSNCPWQDQLTGRYMSMAFVTVSTIYQTVFIAILLLISKGWVLIRSTLNRQQATAVTMLMGAVYITYSAYYVALNVKDIKNIVDALLNFLYIILFYMILKNSIKVLAILKAHLSVIEQNDILTLQQTIRMKISLIQNFIVIIVVFFMFEIIAHGLLPLTNTQDKYNLFTITFHFYYDTMVIMLLMIAFRPRRWPEYFNLGIMDVPLLGINGFDAFQERVQQFEMAPMIYAKVNQQYDSQPSAADYSFSSDKQVLIYNPVFASSDTNIGGQLLQSDCQYSMLNDHNDQAPSSRQQQQQLRNTNPGRALRSLQIAEQDKISKEFNKKRD